MVFHNKAGGYTGGFACKTPNATNPYTTKILVTREGLHLAIQRQWQHVVLECDALQVVQAIGSPSCGLSATSLLIEDVKTSLRSFISMRVSHIRRSANLVAHRMAKLALISIVSSCWFNVPPTSIQDAFLQDCMLA